MCCWIGRTLAFLLYKVEINSLYMLLIPRDTFCQNDALGFMQCKMVVGGELQNAEESDLSFAEDNPDTMFWSTHELFSRAAV